MLQLHTLSFNHTLTFHNIMLLRLRVKLSRPITICRPTSRTKSATTVRRAYYCRDVITRPTPFLSTQYTVHTVKSQAQLLYSGTVQRGNCHQPQSNGVWALSPVWYKKFRYHQSITTFKAHLKTELFAAAYDTV